MKDKEYLNLVASLGCIVCGREAQLHHPRSFRGVGMGKKSSNFLVIPLCKQHHDEIHDRMMIGKDCEHDLLAKTLQTVLKILGNNNG